MHWSSSCKCSCYYAREGYSNPCRFKHWLTPGTVKFAAFHVLSFEGSRGLNILDIADRIQKSGLRDLTTSKTPKASIAAALSRDTKLFERVAPSTYCVRSPYGKDHSDAEVILSTVREKIRTFKNGYVDGVEADDVEKDDDFESDTAVDPEIDDLSTVLTANKDLESSFGANRSEVKVFLGNGVETAHDAAVQNPLEELGNAGESLSLMRLQGFESKNVGIAVAQSMDFGRIFNEATNIDQEDTDIDETVVMHGFKDFTRESTLILVLKKALVPLLLLLEWLLKEIVSVLCLRSAWKQQML